MVLYELCMYSLVNHIENTSNDLEMLLKKYSTNELKTLLMAQDKSKQTILHSLASVKNENQRQAYQLLHFDH